MGRKKYKRERQRKLHFSLTPKSADFASLCNLTTAVDIHMELHENGRISIEKNYIEWKC
jgi:hypothetical protein